MASINQMFVTAINEGITASKGIADPDKKAIACAEIAKALAMTGLVTVSKETKSAGVVSIEEVKEELKETPKTKQVEAPKEPETASMEDSGDAIEGADAIEAAAQEVTVVGEWTEEMQEMFATQLEEVGKLQEEYDDETLDETVVMFSEGALKGIEDITPLNIDGFLAFFKMLLADAEAE